MRRSSANVVKDEVNKSAKRKLDKIALYGRAHKGPRRRRKGKAKANSKTDDSKPIEENLQVSRLPLVNAENTASTAAMVVLESEQFAEAKQVSAEVVGSPVEPGVEQNEPGSENSGGSRRKNKDFHGVQTDGKRKGRWRNQSRNGKSRSRQTPLFQTAHGHQESAKASHIRTQSNYSPSSFIGSPSFSENFHARARSMTYHVRRESLLASDELDHFNSQQIPPSVSYMGGVYTFRPNIRHVSTFSAPGNVNLVNGYQSISPTNVQDGSRQGWTISSNIDSRSSSKTQFAENWWSKSYDERKRRGPLGSLNARTASQDYSLDPESLELLVKDLALALPTPTKGNLPDTPVDGILSSEKKKRTQLAIRLAEEERERRIKENIEEKLKEKLERASRIEWAVKAIESERQRLMTAYSESVDSDRNVITGGKGQPSELEEYEVVCPYSVVGCCVTCTRSELPRHLDVCPARQESRNSLNPNDDDDPNTVYNPLDHVVMCPFRIVGCSVSCPRARLPEHLMKCPYRPEANMGPPNLDHACPGLDGQRTFDSYEVVCPYSILGCEYTCLRSELQNHWATCTFRPKTRQEEEEERHENKKNAIKAAEVERQRRMSLLEDRVREASVYRQQRAEWVVKAAQIEKLRLVCEQLAIERHISKLPKGGTEKKSRRSCSLDEYGDSWGHESDGSVVILSDNEDDCETNQSNRGKRASSLCSVVSDESCRRPELFLRGHLDRQTDALYEVIGQEINEMQNCFTRRIEKQAHLHQVVTEQVLDTVKQLWPSNHIQVKQFGSYATGFAVPGISDLDLVIVMPGRVENRHHVSLGHPISDVAAARWVRESSGGVSADRLHAGIMCGLLGRALRSLTWATQVKVIDRTEVPVIKVATQVGQLTSSTSLNIVHEGEPSRDACETDESSLEVLHVDLTFAVLSHAGLEAVDVVVALKSKFPKLVPLVQLLKVYLHAKNLNNPFTGGLSSYALILMVAASFAGQESNANCTGQELFNFLQLFGKEFNSKKKAVLCSVTRGERNPGLAAKQLHVSVGYRRFSKSMRQGDDMSHVALVVDDPLRPGNNVAKSCFRFSQVQKAFRDALAALLSYVVRRQKVEDRTLLEEVFHVNFQP